MDTTTRLLSRLPPEDAAWAQGPALESWRAQWAKEGEALRAHLERCAAGWGIGCGGNGRLLSEQQAAAQLFLRELTHG